MKTTRGGGKLTIHERNRQRRLRTTEIRRKAVAELIRDDPISFKTIHHRMEKAGHTNPNSGRPWSLGVIHRDVQTLRQEWREAAGLAFEDHVARQLQELSNIKRLALGKGELNAALRAIQLEMKLLGTEAPITINVNLLTTLEFVASRLGLKAEELISSMIIELQESEYAFHDNSKNDS